MMTIDTIEAACAEGQRLDFTRHELEVPESGLRGMFYPLGFPTEVRTNSAEILEHARELWSEFEKRFATDPIRVDVHVIDGGGIECPPTPEFRMTQPLLFNIADGKNYSIADVEQGWTRVLISRATLAYASYFRYFFLLGAPMCHIATRLAMPIHGGCVAFEGRGVLLCGDSGAGKSSLAYACARAGWTYVTDDASYLLRDQGVLRRVTGNCHQVRFRPSAAKLFPEVEGLEITPRAAGKPSIELPTGQMTGLVCAAIAEVDFLVFLNRSAARGPQLQPYPREVARQFLRQVLFGPAESLLLQYAEVERLLKAEVFELSYSDLDWAVDRLKMLVGEGR